MSKQARRTTSSTFRRRVRRMARRFARVVTRTEAVHFIGAEPGVPRGTGRFPIASDGFGNHVFDIEHSEFNTSQDLLDEYGLGYAAGKDKAHFEVRNLSGHARGCGCEPCITTRSVIARHARESRIER